LRTLVVVLVLMVAAVGAQAFDSAAWDEKRNLHQKEVVRLQAVYSNCYAQVRSPAEDVSLPIETFSDGSVKAIVNAKKAQYFLQSGLIWAEGVVIRRFREDGSLEGRIEADNCVVDRMSKNGWVEGSARVYYGKTAICGRRVYFSSPDAYVKVLEDAEVESRDVKFEGVRR